MQNIRETISDTGVLVWTFDRPDSAANIFDEATLMELGERLDGLDRYAQGLVFMSAKPSIFIAGADLNALETLKGAELQRFIELGQSVFNKIAALEMPTVAAIHGACVGGGCELALACRRRIATLDRATKIGLPETQLGILPAWGGSTRLPRLIGVAKALDIILGGKTLAAKAALRRGLIDDIAPKELLLAAAQEWIREHGREPVKTRRTKFDAIERAIAAPIARRKMMEKSRGHYPALPTALEVVARGASVSVEESLILEREAVLELAATPECRNLIGVFQLTERAKKLRVPEAEAHKPATVSRVAVIGAGVMGAAIAQWLSARGLRVLLRDIDAERVGAGMKRIAGLYANAVKARIMDAREARDGMDRVSPATGETPMEFVDLVIEAAVERMELKKEIFERLDEIAPGRALLATNTSALSISELAAGLNMPARVVGIHFFNPVHRMPLVEVISGERTSGEATATALRFVQKIGKMPVLVRDSPGFLVNRILLPYMVEAGELFANGASIEEVDGAMLDFGMPMGPLRLIDEVGLDVAEDVAATLAGAFPGHMHVPAVLGRMKGAGMLGKKAGGGFYIHGKKNAAPNPAAAAHRNPGAISTLDRTTMQRRMALLMINEAARCLEEKVVGAPEDVDFGMIMGAGFAPFRGGPLRYADTLGAAAITDGLRVEAERSGKQFEPCQLLVEMTKDDRRFYANR
jgi:3-hydroxyacyl-CoA dehydrogenase/enoyl-CoA hydratase/3-hydroxybutyryl-CoA epimerase